MQGACTGPGRAPPRGEGAEVNSNSPGLYAALLPDSTGRSSAAEPAHATSHRLDRCRHVAPCTVRAPVRAMYIREPRGKKPRLERVWAARGSHAILDWESAVSGGPPTPPPQDQRGAVHDACTDQGTVLTRRPWGLNCTYLCCLCRRNSRCLATELSTRADATEAPTRPR